MRTTLALTQISLTALSDAELASHIGLGDARALELMMRRHNRLLYRTARSILRDDAEAEDCVQEAYLQAFRSIASFRAESKLSTWLTRIVINQALTRLRKNKRDDGNVPLDNVVDIDGRLPGAEGNAVRIGAAGRRRDARRNAPAPRASHRPLASSIQDGVRPARLGRVERGRNCGEPWHSCGDSTDAFLPRPQPAARSPRKPCRHRTRRCVRLRGCALRPHCRRGVRSLATLTGCRSRRLASARPFRPSQTRSSRNSRPLHSGGEDGFHPKQSPNRSHHVQYRTCSRSAFHRRSPSVLRSFRIAAVRCRRRASGWARLAGRRLQEDRRCRCRQRHQDSQRRARGRVSSRRRVPGGSRERACCRSRFWTWP